MNIINTINTCDKISEDTARLILRLAIGGTVLLHGIFKLTHPEAIGFIGGLFENFHLPALLAYLIYIGEVVAPVMLLVGYQTKVASLLVAVTLLTAIVLAHLGQVFTLGQSGGWAIELQALMLFGSVTIFGLGAGKYSLDAKNKAETVTIPM